MVSDSLVSCGEVGFEVEVMLSVVVGGIFVVLIFLIFTLDGKRGGGGKGWLSGYELFAAFCF